jgi:hypothetical protein
MKKIVGYLQILGLMIFLASCGSKKASNLAEKLTHSTGVQHDVVKSTAKVKDYIVIRNNSTGKYTAYNIKHFNSEMSLNQYYAQVRPGDIQGNLFKDTETKWISEPYWIDTSRYEDQEVWDDYYGGYVYETVWVDDGYWDYKDVMRTFTIYTNFENNMVFDEAESGSKDLEKLGHQSEALSNQHMAKYFVSEYGLSEKRGNNMAKLLKNYNQLNKKRTLTEKDQDIFATKALGVNAKDVQKAMKSYQEGSFDDISDIISKAAMINDITPEHMESILREYLQ